MSARLLRILLLAAGLLFGQLAGLAHGLSHVQDQERPHAPCQLCVAYAAFDHAVAATPTPLPVEHVCARPADALVAAAVPLSSRHYRARAPPPHLV